MQKIKPRSQSLGDLRISAKLTQRAVAALLGLSPGNYNEIESGKRGLPAHHIPKLAEIFGVTPRQVVMVAGGSRLEKLMGALDRTPTHPGGQDVPLPIYGLANVNAGGLIDLGQAPRDVMLRPSFLEGVGDAFALEIVSNTMQPRYEQGELVLVNPNQAPRVGGDCVVRLPDGGAHVARFLSRQGDNVSVQQLNPNVVWNLNMAKIAGVYAIIARLDRR